MVYVYTTVALATFAGACECFAQVHSPVVAGADRVVVTEARSEPIDLDLGLEARSEDDSPVTIESEDWRYSFTAWMWLLGVEGDVGARDITADVNADFGDILDASDSVFAFSGRLELGMGRWGAFVDAMCSDIGVDGVSGPLGFADIDVEFEEILIDFGATYRLGEWEPFPKAEKHRLNTTLDLYAGGRYVDLEIKIDPANASSRSRSLDWVDPIVGLKLVLPLSESWQLAVNGDIGGFGVESDFTWSTTGVFGYEFELFDHPATVYLGYRALGQDYTQGSGNDRLAWDVVQHGPLLGLSLQF